MCQQVEGFVGGSAGVLRRDLPPKFLAVSFLKTRTVCTEPGRIIQQNKCVESLDNQISLRGQDSHPGRWLFSISVAPQHCLTTWMSVGLRTLGHCIHPNFWGLNEGKLRGRRVVVEGQWRGRRKLLGEASG